MLKKTVTSIFTILLVAVVAMSCSEVHLLKSKKLNFKVQSKGHFCIQDPQEQRHLTKFLFVVDKSGSNSWTDRGGRKRAKNIRDFIQEKQQESRKSYRFGMITFQGSRSEAYIEKDGNPIFTDNFQKVYSAIKRIKSNDGGNTPYKAALVEVEEAIKKDMQEFPNEKSNYFVFFISDGQPTDGGGERALESRVKRIISLGSNIVFSTAFYGSPRSTEKEAIPRLKKMSKWGKGKFINFETNDEWDFNQLIVSSDTYVSWQMKNFLVYNLNAGYCEDGQIGTDSDADGMCDRDELRYDGTETLDGKVYRFDPTNRFTSGGAFGDYFYWRELRYGEVVPGKDICNDRSDVDHDYLTACEESYIQNRRPSQNIPQNGDKLNPDTDRDGLLDGLETFVYFTRSLAYAMDPLNLLHTNLDGEEQAMAQIRQHRNPLVPDQGAVAYDTRLEKTDERYRDCYNFAQSILPLYPTLEVKQENTLPGLGHRAGENSVLVYYIQTPQNDPRGDGVLMYSIQRLKNDPVKKAFLSTNAGLKVHNGVFKSYEVPIKSGL